MTTRPDQKPLLGSRTVVHETMGPGDGRAWPPKVTLREPVRVAVAAEGRNVVVNLTTANGDPYTPNSDEAEALARLLDWIRDRHRNEYADSQCLRRIRSEVVFAIEVRP